jgi:hypothetical protein
MTQAPERIWAWSKQDWFNAGASTHKVQCAGGKDVEYIRADLSRPRVKPLVWREYSNNGNCMAETSIGDYVIEDHGENDWGIWLEDNYSPILGPYKTLEEAKAAAQADYERRILEALEPTPDDARAALEAMLDEAEKRGMLRAAEIVRERWASTNAELEAAIRAEAEG